MKKSVLALLTVTLISRGALASADLVKHRAMNQRDQLNAAQGVDPASGQTGAAGQPAQPQGINPVQQQNINKLAQDLAAIRPETPVGDPQKQDLQTDFTTLSKSTVKASAAALTKLGNDLIVALSGKGVTVREQAQIARNVNIVLNCVNLTPAHAQSFAAAAQKSLQSGGVPDELAQKVGDDLRAIVTDLQKNKPKSY